eukprot:3088241-Pyramimonas_sp.AAC.1
MYSSNSEYSADTARAVGWVEEYSVDAGARLDGCLAYSGLQVLDDRSKYERQAAEYAEELASLKLERGSLQVGV